MYILFFWIVLWLTQLQKSEEESSRMISFVWKWNFVAKVVKTFPRYSISFQETFFKN